MAVNILFSLLFAWIFDYTLNLSSIVSQGVYELFKIKVSISGYYVIFIMIGIFGQILYELKK